MTRRTFFKRTLIASPFLIGGTAGYSRYIERHAVEVVDVEIALSLPKPLTAALLSDIHFDPLYETSYLEAVVARVNELSPDLILFAEAGGLIVACVVVLPDVNQVLKRMHGRLLPFGLLHFLNRKRIVNRVRLVLLGVIPEYRSRGLYPLMVAEAHKRAVANGYLQGEMSWTLEDNDEINAGIVAAGGRRSRTYRLYEKPLG